MKYKFLIPMYVMMFIVTLIGASSATWYDAGNVHGVFRDDFESGNSANYTKGPTCASGFTSFKNTTAPINGTASAQVISGGGSYQCDAPTDWGVGTYNTNNWNFMIEVNFTTISTDFIAHDQGTGGMRTQTNGSNIGVMCANGAANGPEISGSTLGFGQRYTIVPQYFSSGSSFNVSVYNYTNATGGRTNPTLNFMGRCTFSTSTQNNITGLIGLSSIWKADNLCVFANATQFNQSMYEACVQIGTPSATNFTITATNGFNGLSVLSFSANVTNSTLTQTYSTTTGTITTNHLSTDTDPLNITIQSTNFFNYTNNNYSSSSNLNASLPQYPIVYLINKWTQNNFSNGTINIDNTLYNSINSTSELIYVPYNTTKNVTTVNPSYLNNTVQLSLLQNTINSINISQSIINFTLNDTDNNIPYTNFSIYLNNTLVCSVTGTTCTGYPNAGFYSNLTIKSINNDFYNDTRNFTVTALSNNITVLDINSKINVTFLLKNFYSSNYISNFSVYLNNTNVCNASTSSGCSYVADRIGNFSVNITSPSYATVVTNTTFNHTQNQTYTYIISPIANFTFYDEQTGGAFNMSSATSIELQIICPTQTISSVIPTTGTNSFSTNLTCEFQQFNIVVYYGTTGYFRELFYPSYTLDYTSVPVYLMNLNIVTGAAMEFVLDDTLSNYPNPAFVINRYYGTTYRQITGGQLDMSGKISAYLIQNGRYIVDLYSNDVFVKSMGEYVATNGGVFPIRLYTLQFGATPSGFGEEVSYDIYEDNSTGDNYVISNYLDTANDTSMVTFKVFNNNLSGSVVYSTFTTSPSAQFTYNISPYSSSSLLCLLNISAHGINVPYIKSCHEATIVTPTDDIIQYIDPEVRNWAIIIIISVLALYATANTASVISFVILAFTALAALLNWLALGSMRTRFISIITVGVLITVLYYWAKSNKEVET